MRWLTYILLAFYCLELRASEGAETRLSLPGGDVVLTTEGTTVGSHRQQLIWAEHGKEPSILFETGLASVRGPQLSLGAVYKENSTIGVVISNGIGGADYFCFRRKGAQWNNTDRAILGSVPFDSRGIQMTSATTFDWLREGKPADRFEITSDLRSPGTIYRHVKKNGIAYVPGGSHFTIELPPLVTFKKSEATEVKPLENTTILAAPSNSKPPYAKPASPPSTKPTSSIPWSIIVVLIVAATGLLWSLKKRK